MFDLLVKAHGLLGHHIMTGLYNEPGTAQNPSFVPMGPNEVSSVYTAKTSTPCTAVQSTAEARRWHVQPGSSSRAS